MVKVNLFGGRPFQFLVPSRPQVQSDDENERMRDDDGKLLWETGPVAMSSQQAVMDDTKSRAAEEGNHFARTIQSLVKPRLGFQQATRISAASTIPVEADTGIVSTFPALTEDGDSIKILQRIGPPESKEGQLNLSQHVIKIEDVDQPIPESQREEVKKALMKSTFDVSYTCEQFLGKPDTMTFILENKHIVQDDQEGDDAVKPSIIWRAHDHKFPCKHSDANGLEVEKTITCVDYYKEKYGIVLEFPNMPVVRVKVGRNEAAYFPLEFLQHVAKQVQMDHEDECYNKPVDKATQPAPAPVSTTTSDTASADHFLISLKRRSLLLGFLVGCFIQSSSLVPKYILNIIFGHDSQVIQANRMHIFCLISLVWSILTSMMVLFVFFFAQSLIVVPQQGNTKSSEKASIEELNALFLRLEHSFALGLVSICVAWTFTDVLLGLNLQAYHSMLTLVFAITGRFIVEYMSCCQVTEDDDEEDKQFEGLLSFAALSEEEEDYAVRSLMVV